MGALVFVELDGEQIKKSSLEAVSFAKEVDGDVAALVFGHVAGTELDLVGKAGAAKILHVTDEQLAQPNIMAYSSAVRSGNIELVKWLSSQNCPWVPEYHEATTLYGITARGRSKCFEFYT